ncbi:MAG TPA: hypothetical protein VM580_25435, partial [Labilithrix sp.]|nr:hypothetical protein [Labilithrix sp.]
TQFNLADCREKIGKLSAAWSGFVNVATAARAQNQPQREQIARARANALEARFPRLAIDVPAPAHGLEVKCDGVIILADDWARGIVVDPGLHRITASAPGKKPWEGAVRATEGKTVRISIPPPRPVAAGKDARERVVLAPTATASPPPPVQRKEPLSLPQDSTPVGDTPGSTQRAIGFVLAGIGIAGMGTGAGFGIDSLQARAKASDHCAGDLCTARGVALRDRAIESGDASTISMAAGGAVLIGGIVLLLTAPRAGPRPQAPSRAFRVAPHVGKSEGIVTFQGEL